MFDGIIKYNLKIKIYKWTKHNSWFGFFKEEEKNEKDQVNF